MTVEYMAFHQDSLWHCRLSSIHKIRMIRDGSYYTVRLVEGKKIAFEKEFKGATVQAAKEEAFHLCFRFLRKRESLVESATKRLNELIGDEE